MNRGEVWFVDFGYVSKVRPVLILSVAPHERIVGSISD
jgi:mRNA-degrading endonuclease toxin of MazEF toxin-antitoxin module